MFDLVIKGGTLVDPLNRRFGRFDVAIKDGKIAQVAEDISSDAKQTIKADGKKVIPGIIDMHTHMRTILGHPHAQRMVALAGVCTTVDMAGPLDNILDTIPGSGAGINMAILEAASHPQSLSSGRPDAAERKAFIEKSLSHGAIGIKLLGGHFPMDLDICQRFIEDSFDLKSWVGWHIGNSTHGSNIEGVRDAVEVAKGKFLHMAHVNSYCRAQVSNEIDEALEAIDLLKKNPNIFSESYLSPLNGTRLTIKDNVPITKVTATCLKKVGCTADYAGMKEAILKSYARVLYDDGRIGKLIGGQEGVDYWESKGTVSAGSFAVNPAASRYLVATAKRDDGTFVVDSFSTDGGCYPRNVIVENGLLLIKFGALTWMEYAAKASLNGARALGLPSKGHLSEGADADVTIIDEEKEKAYATIVDGKPIMLDGELLGSGTCIICDARGAKYLESRGIKHLVKNEFNMDQITNRFLVKEH